MKTGISKKIISFIAAGSVFLSVLSASENQSPLSNVADQLEEAIFLQEGEGDLSMAIKKYYDVIESSSHVRTIAAEAQYRLAECYWEQGNEAQAKIEFAILVDKYPEESEWVDAAQARLPQAFVPTIDPFVDGERYLYKYNLPTGKVVGYRVATNRLYDWEGRTLWRKEDLINVGGSPQLISVEFDPETFATVYSGVEGNGIGNVNCWFEDDGKSVKAEFGDDGDTKEFSFPSRVYDNEQVIELIRQFPVEIGHSSEINIFVNFTGIRIPTTFTIKEILELDTVLGSVECYKVEIDLAESKQYVYVTNDDRRIVVKFELGGLSIDLDNADVYVPGSIKNHKNEDLEYTFDYVDEWVLIPGDSEGKYHDEQVFFLYGSRAANVGVSCYKLESFNAYVEGDMAATAKNMYEQLQKGAYKDFTFDESTYSISEANGLDVFLVEGYVNDENGNVEKRCLFQLMIGDNYSYRIEMRSEIKIWSTLRERIQVVIDSFSDTSYDF